jgi:hypothetical protein
MERRFRLERKHRRGIHSTMVWVGAGDRTDTKVSWTPLLFSRILPDAPDEILFATGHMTESSR